MCAKFGASWFSRLVVFPDALFFDTLTPPQMPHRSQGANFYLAHYHVKMHLHVCAKFGPVRTKGGDVHALGRIHTHSPI